MTDLLARLPPPYQPFVVRDDFVVRADLFPLPGTYNGRFEEHHFELDDQFETYLSEKLSSMYRAPEKYRSLDLSKAGALSEAYLRLFRIFAGEYPECVTFDGDMVDLRLLGLSLDIRQPQNIVVALAPDAPEIGQRVGRWIDAQTGIYRLGDALALSCQEDLVIMRLLEDGRHHAESLHVLLPSTWNPREKYQQSLATIHEPVADSGRLISAADNVMKAIVTKGPYLRFGLSLTTLGALDSHPDHPKPWDSAWLDDLNVLASKCTVRIERQTTFPMPDLGRALFSVRIYTTPLVELAGRRPDLIPRLAVILRSATPAVLAYKGMSEYALPMAEWCERFR